MPEPDLAVVRGVPRDYLAGHPTGRDALLVVEVAVTSQVPDRAKAAVYARGGVPLYWLVDVQERCVTVFAEPSAQGDYGQCTTLRAEDEIGWNEVDARWPVSAFLP